MSLLLNILTLTLMHSLMQQQDAVVIAKNILYASPISSPSHHLWNRALALGLVARGHNVTMIGPDKDNVPTPDNYTLILMEGMYEVIDKSFETNEMVNLGPFEIMHVLPEWSMMQCRHHYETSGLDALLHYPDDFRFDLILMDVTIGPCLYPLIDRFHQPPVIAVTAFLLPAYISEKFGIDWFASFVPWYGMSYTNEMTFVERCWNFVYTVYELYVIRPYEYAMQEKLARLKFDGMNNYKMTPWSDLERNFSLLLANIDSVLNYPQPITPNIIPVGGLHIKPAKKLPQDLQNILDDAKNGFILFSLGTNVRSDKLDEMKRQALLKAFSKMPELILWKFESPIADLPKNVIVRKWLPQNDLLGHPKIRLFITHGGALSTQEAMSHGVPVVVMPFMIDQYVHARMVIKKKVGQEMSFHQLSTSDYVFDTVRGVLDNPIYTSNAKRISQIYKDQPQSPLERALFWIEFVLKYGDVSFLDTPARDMPIFVSSSADVVLFFTILVILAVLAIFKFIRYCLDRCKPMKVKVN